jgi:hypothetical protein
MSTRTHARARYAKRLASTYLQICVVFVPGMPACGSVVRVLGGDLAKEAGLVPAATPQP